MVLDILLKLYLLKNLHYLQLLVTKSLKSTLQHKTKAIKHELTKMPVVTHSAKPPLDLWLPLGIVKEIILGVLLSFDRIVVIAGVEEVGSPSSTCAATNESQSFLSFGMFKCEDKERLMCPKYIT